LKLKKRRWDKMKKLDLARIKLDKNMLDIHWIRYQGEKRLTHQNGGWTDPGRCAYFGKPKDIKAALITFIEKYFTLPIEIEIIHIRRR
jgi:hypothetical protein